MKEKYFNGKRITGIFLIIMSLMGIVLFKIMNWDGIIFYLSFGWGLGMLL